MKADNPDGYPSLRDAEAMLALRRSEATKYLTGWHEQAKEDIAFRHGHQWGREDARLMNGGDEDEDGRNRMVRPMVTFNRINSLVNATFGAMIHNPMGISYVERAVTPENEEISKHVLLSSAALYFRENPLWDAPTQERDSALDMLTCGIGVQQLMAETEITGQVELLGRRIDPLSVGWDTRAKAMGLTDRRWHFRKAMLSREEMDEEFGGVPEARASDEPSSTPAKPEEPGVESDDNFEVLHWQWFESEKYKSVLTVDGPQDISLRDLKALKEGEDYIYEDELAATQVKRRRVYWEAFTHGGTIMRIRKIPVGAFTYLFLTGIRDDENGYWYGMVRDAKDPQRWANKFLSLFIWVVATSGKGIIAEEGAFPNAQDAQRDWANPAVITEAIKGAVSGGMIMPKPESKLPPSAHEILSFCNAAVREVTGISLEIVAQQMNDQSGIVEESRKAAAMAVVAWAFAALRDYYRAHGHLLLRFIAEYIEPDRLVRTVDASGRAQFRPFTYEEAAYEVEVDEIPNSPNKRAETHRTLVAYAPIVQQPDIPPAFKMEYLTQMAETSGLPAENVRRLKQAMTPPPDPMAEQMKLAQAETVMQELEKLKAEVVKLQSAALLDVAKAKETGQEAETAQRISQTEIEQKVIEGNLKLELQRRKADQELEKGTMKLQMDEARNQQVLQLQHDQQQLRAAEPKKSGDSE